MEAVGRRRKTARERRDQCLRAEARRLRRAQAMGAAMVHRGDKYQGDPFLVLGARLDVLEQQVALSRELSSGAVVSLQAALDCCSSGVTELQDVLVPGLRNDVGLLQEAFDRCSSGVTELQDAVLPGLRDDVNRCSSGVDELRLELVPKLQVDVERFSALSPAG